MHLYYRRPVCQNFIKLYDSLDCRGVASVKLLRVVYHEVWISPLYNLPYYILYYSVWGSLWMSPLWAIGRVIPSIQRIGETSCSSSEQIGELCNQLQLQTLIGIGLMVENTYILRALRLTTITDCEQRACVQFRHVMMVQLAAVCDIEDDVM